MNDEGDTANANVNMDFHWDLVQKNYFAVVSRAWKFFAVDFAYGVDSGPAVVYSGHMGKRKDALKEIRAEVDFLRSVHEALISEVPQLEESLALIENSLTDADE